MLLTEKELLVANTGSPFTRLGVISICAAHLSAKQRRPPVDDFDARDEHLLRAIIDRELDTYRLDLNRLTSDYSTEDEIRRDHVGRAIWEILQNADDSMASPGAAPGGQIGSKGIGFKAVMQLSAEPEIHSPPYHFGFSSIRTQELLRSELSVDSPPPLTFRVPHGCPPGAAVQDLINKGYVTILRLPFRDDRAHQSATDGLQSLPAHILLLTQHIRAMSLNVGGVERKIEIEPLDTAQGGDISVLRESGREPSRWRRWLPVTHCDPNASLSAAVCLPIGDGGQAQPSASEMPLHVFFPTEDFLGVHALIHASFDVESSRKHARPSDDDAAVIDLLAECITECIREIPSQSVVGAFGGISIDHDTDPLRPLCEVVGKLLRETAYVEVVGGGRVRPDEARVWEDNLGEVVRDDSETVRTHNLIVPALLPHAATLRSLGTNAISNWEHLKLLQECSSDSLEDAMRSLRAVLGGGIARAADLVLQSDKERALRLLRDCPCWWTERGEVKRLSETPLKLRESIEDWPAWLPVDVIHTDQSHEVRKWIANKNPAPSPQGLAMLTVLLSGHMAATPENCLRWGLAPAMKKWRDEDWEELGWEALALCATWGGRLSHSEPWVPAPPEQGSLQDLLATIVRVPVIDGWRKASNTYAGTSWGGQHELVDFFPDVNLRPLDHWPNSIRQKQGFEEWVVLLRSIGVSWEPKPRLLTSWPNERADLDRYLEEANLRQFRHLQLDWDLSAFPECLSGIQDVALLAEMLAYLDEKIVRTRAVYLKRGGGREYGPTGYRNFAAYQLRHEAWVPCSPALLHPMDHASPSETYFPGRGFSGLLPEVKLGEDDGPERARTIQRLEKLGVRWDLPDRVEPWHEWMRKLADVAEGSPVPEEEEEDPDSLRTIRSAARSLYKNYLLLDWDNATLPEDIRVPHMARKDGRSQIGFSDPQSVMWIDEPYLAAETITTAILDQGVKLFVCDLDSGVNSPERLGVERLSDQVVVEPCFGSQFADVTDRVRKRYCERRLALAKAAKVATARLPAELPILAVQSLWLEVRIGDDALPAIHSASWLKDGTLLVDGDGDIWRHLSVGLARWVLRTERHQDLFENLLRATGEELSERLREHGLTVEDLQDTDLKPFPVTVGRPGEGETPGGEEGDDGDSPTNDDGQRQGTMTSDLPPPRPDPVPGLRAEDWFHGRLISYFGNVRRRVRDELGRESDLVFTEHGQEHHIEIKHIATGGNTFFWSDLEYEKARDLRVLGMPYWIGILTPHEDGEFRVYWSWDPCTDLLAFRRTVTWEQASGSVPLESGSWDVGQLEQGRSWSRAHYRFAVRVSEIDLELRFERDDSELTFLRGRV
jgi:hypothetical protein